METKYTSEWVTGQKAKVIGLIQCGCSMQEAPQELYACYSVNTPQGKNLCAAFSDDELLALLQETAKALGHSPAQGEVHWLLREYLRSRFRNWPGALRAAGLSRAAGRGGLSSDQAAQKGQEIQELLAQVRETAKALGRIPHPSDLPQIGQRLKKRYQTWGAVLTAAGAEEAAASGLQKFDKLSDSDKQHLAALQTRAQTLNRAPLRSEVPDELRVALVQRFGSWRNALYQIGLEPVRRITPFVNAPLFRRENRCRATHRGDLYDCHYRILHLDPETAADLAFLHNMTEKLGRPPRRREVPPEIRKRLQEACGSWSNALFQLGLSV